MKIEAPYYDNNGVEIQEGDLLKIYHFRHYLRRRKMYMYHVAILQDWGEAGLFWAGKVYHREGKKGHYTFRAVANSDRILKGFEVIAKVDPEKEDQLRSEGHKRINQLQSNTK